mgnify:CR=1 FL=1
MFQPFPKIARLSREMVITEKLDGTNGAVAIRRIQPEQRETIPAESWFVSGPDGEYAMWAQSKSRIIAPVELSGDKTSDNYGFAAWAFANRYALLDLGEGVHFGEWWGQGIQRNYGLREKRWSLFNVERWVVKHAPPPCCHVVPVLHRGQFSDAAVAAAMDRLLAYGSVAVPGYGNPEGVIVFHTAARVMLKKTFEKDDAGKEAA